MSANPENGTFGELKRSLRRRHLNMIAIGGAIGTGLFFASGSAISTSGPGGALFAYAVMGLLVYFLMTSLGEMATLIPTSGSFETYASRFVDPALGFALGWNYWFSWAITVAAELVAAALIIKFWFPESIAIFGITLNSGVTTTLWSMLFLAVLFSLNILSARAYGEGEYWFAGIKVVTIILFLIVGILMIFGIMGGKSPGFTNWFAANADGAKAPFIGGAFAMINVFLVAGWSFQGTELVGLAAGESENPRRDVPRAINAVFWRILLFYIGAIAIIGFLISFTDPNLLKSGAENIAHSPFTMVFERSGIAFAASLMNAVILTSVLSCGNSGLYAASRMIYAMAKEKKAPAFFGKTNGRGVPMNAICVTTIIASFAFFASLVGSGKIYMILYSASGLTGFFAWFGIAISHYRFRKAYVAQGGKLEDLQYRSKFYPAGPIVAMILCLIVIFGANSWVFPFGGTPWEKFSWFDFTTNYALIPMFFAIYLGYKFAKKTKVVPLKECDFKFQSTGLSGFQPGVADLAPEKVAGNLQPNGNQ